jgi:hypothetical protein
VRLHRRQYRLDITTGSPCSIAQEVDDGRAVARLIDEPMLVVGHSSGEVVALEAMVASPAGSGLPNVTTLPAGGEAEGVVRVDLVTGRIETWHWWSRTY